VGCRGLGGFDLVVRDRRALVGPPFAHGDHVGPKSGVRGKDSVIAMAMDAWWRDEAGQALKQLEGREEEDGPAVGRGSG